MDELKNVKVGDKLWHKIYLRYIIINHIYSGEEHMIFPGDFLYNFEDEPNKIYHDEWYVVSLNEE